MVKPDVLHFFVLTPCPFALRNCFPSRRQTGN